VGSLNDAKSHNILIGHLRKHISVAVSAVVV